MMSSAQPCPLGMNFYAEGSGTRAVAAVCNSPATNLAPCWSRSPTSSAITQPFAVALPTLSSDVCAFSTESTKMESDVASTGMFALTRSSCHLAALVPASAVGVPNSLSIFGVSNAFTPLSSRPTMLITTGGNRLCKIRSFTSSRSFCDTSSVHFSTLASISATVRGTGSAGIHLLRPTVTKLRNGTQHISAPCPFSITQIPALSPCAFRACIKIGFLSSAC
mmetsp:Transcript_13822/g.20100  ORF Transcript_13822/g.20100 Transcript_13822/m.20100 type:complete len:222 (+) Transcript_13822:244-909(+)